MEKQLKGITLVLFGILLCCADNTINSTILHSFSDFPFAFVGVCFGIAGLIFVFWKSGSK